MTDKPTYEELEKRILELEELLDNSKLKLQEETLLQNENREKLIYSFKKAENNLKENENLFKAITNQTTEGVGVSDMVGNYIFVNPAFCKMVGFSEDELLKMTVFDVKAKVQPKTSFFESKNDLKNLPIQVILKRKDNSEFLTEIVGNVIKISNQDFVLGTVRDISDREKSEFIIQQKNNKLQELNADKDRFITILGHDLKNPFNTILGFLNLLVKNIRNYDIDKIEKQLNIVNNSAQNTFKLLEDILLWAKAQTGKLPMKPQKLIFTNICQDIIENMKHIANPKNITINYFSEELITVFADIDMLKTILRNLVSNSIKFTNNNGRIDIYAVKNNMDITITVSDNGIGIEPAKISTLFDISQIASTAGTANEKGTGFGLLLCKEFVEKHNGKIWVESQLGKGSDFKFTMPLCND